MPFTLFCTRNFLGFAGRLSFICWLAFILSAAPDAGAADNNTATPLLIANRTIHVFRAPIGTFSATERAEGARKRIEQALELDGTGWTSVKSTPSGLVVELDEKPMFYVLPNDANELAGETPDELANRASRALQKVWQESRERRDPGINVRATVHVLIALSLLILTIMLILNGSRWLQGRLGRLTENRLQSLPTGIIGARITTLIPVAIKRVLVITAWLSSLLVLFVFLTYSLGQFVVTRPASENLSQSISGLFLQILHGITSALPGIFVSILIFLASWGATRISTAFFAHVENLPPGSGILNGHTAPATRRVVNASLWLFAIAMAYPYLPGSHTEAFKGVSVILGLMVSIGASGLIGQIASGVMLAYTNALMLGEYVRILDCEGTVTELGTFVTRLRTGTGEEIALPNTLVLSNVTRNFSRESKGRGFLLDTSLSIGYDTPWRQVHALLLDAARQIPEVDRSREPFVIQSALSDFYVVYKLVVYVDSDQPNVRAKVMSNLLAAIQDAFNRHGVQIMSPQYFEDPQKPKIVPESDWYLAPAKPPENKPAPEQAK